MKYVAAVVKLFDEGATVPFISRYRKELTGSVDYQSSPLRHRNPVGYINLRLFSLTMIF